MYPVIRMLKELAKNRNAEPLALTGTHVSTHICWPWDIDIWMELNNGRTLTLLDLGRIPLAMRIGLINVMRRERWSMTMAGVSVRYRRRIKTFERFEIRSRAVCWDDKFVYLEQSSWKKNGECANHALYRAALTDKNGIVSPARVIDAMGITATSPETPNWVQNWIDAEGSRPWPPMQD
ncbi:acyl-CoA thioesterase [Shimia sp. SDUM112013]|uniref:acyl-CoA thioesterase n=1 Tax=Shimia sp. SDUM112013 TaxID=3136160 RepID=UPI0032ED6FB5